MFIPNLLCAESYSILASEGSVTPPPPDTVKAILVAMHSQAAALAQQQLRIFDAKQQACASSNERQAMQDTVATMERDAARLKGFLGKS